MKTLIVYKSQTGFTERYAKWIGEETSGETMTLKEVREEILGNYDVILYGGGVQAGSISGYQTMKKLMSKLPDKKFILFCTGATPAEETKAIQDIKSRNLGECTDIPFFYLQSGLNYEKMKGPGKLMMKMFANMLEKKADKTQEEKAMAQVIKESHDISDKKYITPVIACIKEMELA